MSGIVWARAWHVTHAAGEEKGVVRQGWGGVGEGVMLSERETMKQTRYLNGTLRSMRV